MTNDVLHLRREAGAGRFRFECPDCQGVGIKVVPVRPIPKLLRGRKPVAAGGTWWEVQCRDCDRKWWSRSKAVAAIIAQR